MNTDKTGLKSDVRAGVRPEQDQWLPGPSDHGVQRTLNYSPFGGVIGNRLLKAAHATALVYPLVLVGAFYGAWLLAWAKLGHAPRPSWDDPSETLGLIYIASALPMALMQLGAAATICSVVCRFLLPGSRLAALAFSVLIAALWLGSIAFLRWDPIGVANWWAD